MYRSERTSAREGPRAAAFEIPIHQSTPIYDSMPRFLGTVFRISRIFWFVQYPHLGELEPRETQINWTRFEVAQQFVRTVAVSLGAHILELQKLLHLSLFINCEPVQRRGDKKKKKVAIQER